MKLEKQNLDKNTKLAKKVNPVKKSKVNPVKKSDDSNSNWLIQEVVAPIVIALIPALIPLAITYITPQNTQQPANPAIDRTIPPSK